MEFDKSKVYTVFNADEVKIGSKGYFSDYKHLLIKHIQSEDKDFYSTILNIETDNEYAFKTHNGNLYRYFYLVEEPKEKTKRPCTREEFIEMLKKQGISMVKSNMNGFDYTVEKLLNNDETLDEFLEKSKKLNKTMKEDCQDYLSKNGSKENDSKRIIRNM